MKPPLPDFALDRIFLEARTHNVWSDEPVDEAVLRRVVDLAKMGPTSANSLPARFVFIISREAKERLRPHLAKGNVEKTMAAPVTVIVAYDLEFYERLHRYFPHEPKAREWFAGKPKAIEANAFRNGSLQGAYLIIAARALGLDCGPMSGFSNEGVDAEFFPDGKVKSNFLCNLGYGVAEKLHSRSPRPSFDEIAEIR